MARYANNPSVESLPSGKIKGTVYQVRRHYGQAYLMRAPGPRTSFSSAEKEAQQRFAEATRLASLDMKNPQAKAYWNAHKKQYKRAYDAAKAHYLRLLNTPIPPKKQSKPLSKPTNQRVISLFGAPECAIFCRPPRGRKGLNLHRLQLRIYFTHPISG